MHPISTCNIILLLQLLLPSISPQLLLYFNTQISSSGAWELGGKLLSQKSLRSKVFTLHSPRCSIWSNKQLWQVHFHNYISVFDEIKFIIIIIIIIIIWHHGHVISRHYYFVGWANYNHKLPLTSNYYFKVTRKKVLKRKFLIQECIFGSVCSW